MFQFGIRSMLAVTLVAAGLFGVVFALPATTGTTVLTYANRLLVPLLIAGVVYGRGYSRAFAIGGLTWFGLPLVSQDDLTQMYNTAFTMGMTSVEPDRVPHLVRMLMAGVSGLLAVGVRFVSLPGPVPAPAPAAATESAKPLSPEETRERLPAWIIPMATMLLLVGAMVGWLKLEPEVWNPTMAAPPGFFPTGATVGTGVFQPPTMPGVVVEPDPAVNPRVDAVDERRPSVDLREP
jgi:hypothetical protein